MSNMIIKGDPFLTAPRGSHGEKNAGPAARHTGDQVSVISETFEENSEMTSSSESED
jgi:hypothetical protein